MDVGLRHFDCKISWILDLIRSDQFDLEFNANPTELSILSVFGVATGKLRERQGGQDQPVLNRNFVQIRGDRSALLMENQMLSRETPDSLSTITQ